MSTLQPCTRHEHVGCFDLGKPRVADLNLLFGSSSNVWDRPASFLLYALLGACCQKVEQVRQSTAVYDDLCLVIVSGDNVTHGSEGRDQHRCLGVPVPKAIVIRWCMQASGSSSSVQTRHWLQDRSFWITPKKNREKSKHPHYTCTTGVPKFKVYSRFLALCNSQKQLNQSSADSSVDDLLDVIVLAIWEIG